MNSLCGRFNILTDVDTLLAAFDILSNQSEVAEFESRFNISPSQKNKPIDHSNDSLTKIPIVRFDSRGKRVLRNAIWPLVPFWAGPVIPKYSTANARSETMMTAASYRGPWKSGQRCLIPATGFYEWQIIEKGKPKQPWHIFHTNQPIMSFAGLWERGRNTAGDTYESCTIVTTEANKMMSEIHNSNKRMPVIVDPENRDTWLSDDNDAALGLVRPYEEDRLDAYPISTLVNNPTYRGPGCIERLETKN